MINSKSQKKLEFDKVLEVLSQQTVSELGRKKAMHLQPSSDRQMIDQWQGETSEALALIDRQQSMPIARFSDLSQVLKRLNRNATLSGEELIAIAHLLQIAREIKEFFAEMNQDETNFDYLQEVVKQIDVPKNLEKYIYTRLEDNGEVKNSASQKLSSLRKQISQIQQNIRSQLDQFTRGSQSKYLSENLVTMRGDSYVLPVKAEHKSHVKGIVHDQSASGQTVFIEPQNVHQLNNQLRQVRSQEKYEIQRILLEMSKKCQPHTSEINHMMNLLARLDVIQAKALYARQTDAIRPIVSDNQEVKFFEARHPLIAHDEIVPNDITIGSSIRTIVVTGPNTGGKTVILKTLGLLQLMGQSGLHLPVASGSQMAIFDQVLADIGDEQSIEQNLSTFSSHMTTIVQMIDQATSDSLLLFDELGAGTDPQEGASLAIAILDALHDKKATVMITSHYPELKAYGYNQDYVMNASMEFDSETLEPTYRFLSGIPGRSNALEIAHRLGLNDSIIHQARQGISGQSQQVDEMIADLSQKQQLADQKEKDFHKHLIEAETWHRKLKKAYEDFTDEKDQWMEKAKKKYNDRLQRESEKAERIMDDIRQMQARSGRESSVKEHELIDAKTRLHDLRAEEKSLAQNKVLQKAKDQKKIKVGQTVQVLSLNQQGTVVEELDENHWMVQLGMMKLKVHEDDLKVVQDNNEEKGSTGTTVRASVGSVSNELDLRGKRVEDALLELDQYLDQALLAHLKQVTIIHGVGTGAVRQAVHKALDKDSRVKSYKIAPANQGGAGATNVKF